MRRLRGVMYLVTRRGNKVKTRRGYKVNGGCVLLRMNVFPAERCRDLPQNVRYLHRLGGQGQKSRRRGRKAKWP